MKVSKGDGLCMVQEKVRSWSGEGHNSNFSDFYIGGCETCVYIYDSYCIKEYIMYVAVFTYFHI